MTRVFPTIMVGLSIGAAVVYAWAGDARRAICWTAAAVLTAAVTF